MIPKSDMVVKSQRPLLPKMLCSVIILKLVSEMKLTTILTPHIYNHGLVCIGEKSVVPSGVTIGKNVVISGVTAAEDYPDNNLASGKSLIKAGE